MMHRGHPHSMAAASSNRATWPPWHNSRAPTCRAPVAGSACGQAAKKRRDRTCDAGGKNPPAEEVGVNLVGIISNKLVYNGDAIDRETSIDSALLSNCRPVSDHWTIFSAMQIRLSRSQFTLSLSYLRLNCGFK